TAALSRVASRKMPIADAVKLYGTVADREMRQPLIHIYRQRPEPEATDKLLDIVKNDTDYNLRRQAINAVTRKNDPRATKLLMELIDKCPPRPRSLASSSPAWLSRRPPARRISHSGSRPPRR